MTTTTRTWKDALITEPAQLVTAQPAQVGISALSMLFTAIFFAAPLLTVAWLPREIVFVATGAAALGVEYAFLKGIADRAFVEARGGVGFWGDLLVYTTGALLIVAGVTVLLTYAYKLEAFARPHWAFAAVLALVHIVPLATIGVCSAQLHAQAQRHERQQRDAEAAEERARALRLQEEADARARRRQELDEAAEERRRVTAEEIEAAKLKALARLEYRQAAATQASPTTVTERHERPSPTVTAERHAASPSPRDVFKAAVVAAYRDDPQFNRAALAREHGWSRPAVATMLAEARSSGELEP